MAIRVEQTPLVLETSNTSGHLRVSQAYLVLEVVPLGTTSVQLIGSFLDLNGNPLANGYLTVLLPESVVTLSGKQLTATSVRVPLDNNGAIAGTFVVYPTDLFSGGFPGPTLYRVSVHSADGTRAWKASHTMTVLAANGPVQNISTCLDLSSD